MTDKNKKNVITVTQNAISEVKHLLAQSDDKDVLGIRVGVKSGGCSGFTYFIEYAKEQSKFDEVIEIDNIKLLIDPKALMYVMGSEMDYKQEEFSSGFIFTNPNEKARCGCGKSFNV